MKQKIKRRLSLLLVLCLAAAWMPAGTLTARAAEPAEGAAIFDRCDGSEPFAVDPETEELPDTTLYTADNPDGAWQTAIGDAVMYGYRFAGWYTAPNGWGTKVNGTESDPFKAGETYYAKWEWTRSYVDYDMDSNDRYYALLTPARTVYTTCLDFTGVEQSGVPVTGDGYAWEDGVLTLDGVHIQARGSACGIILPADSTIEIGCLKDGWQYGTAVDETGAALEDGRDYSDNRNAANVIACREADNIADVLCAGDLTIRNMTASADDEEALGNWLNAEQGGICVQGELNISEANVSAHHVRAAGDIAVQNDAMVFADAYTSMPAGDHYVVSEAGSVYINNSYLFTDSIEAKTDLTISDRESRVWVGFRASAGGTIFLSDSGYKARRDDTDNYALNFGHKGGEDTGLYANDISISNSVLKTSAIHAKNNMTVLEGSEVDVCATDMLFPVQIDGPGTIADSTFRVTELNANTAVGIWGTERLSVNRSTVQVSAVQDEKPFAAIVVEGKHDDPGLVLRDSVLTAPAGCWIKKYDSAMEEELVYWVVVASQDSDDAVGEVTISPVVYVDDTPETYPVTVSQEIEGGAVKTSPKNASRGDTVTLTVTADQGYALAQLTVTDKNGQALTLTDGGSGKYTFTMPAGKVEIHAVFKAVGAQTAGPAYEGFADLAQDAWYHEGVAYVLEQGLMNGVVAGSFAPEDATSRAMAVTVLWRMAGCPAVDAAVRFEDVAADAWYADAVRWAASAGILQTGSGAFDPDSAITRQELACMMYRYARHHGRGFTGAWMMQLAYPDAQNVSDWAYEAMCWCTVNGVIQGTGDGRLEPVRPAARAETAVMLMRFAESMK